MSSILHHLLRPAMGSEAASLHMLFFPYMAPGHMIPSVDMAKLFAERGVKVSIVTTPANASLIQGTLDRANEFGHRRIGLILLQFPSAAVGLPDGCENVASLTSVEMRMNFFKAVDMLRQPFDEVLKEHLPDCIVTDSFLPWTLDVASELGIPRIVFHGTSFFSLCATEIMHNYNPHEILPSEIESFVVPGLPHRIEMLKSQIPELHKWDPKFVEVMKKVRESDMGSYGVVVNSFYELEPDYAEHFRKVVGKKAWHVGPVSLCNQDVGDKAVRGDKASIDHNHCLNWLDNKRPDSVVYVCFGSMNQFTNAQLREMALGLEASNHPFIWVVRETGGKDASEWLPEGFEEKGLIIRGWAPQILILNHPAVGGFMTHCGWNSSLEGISAGVPMITWPLFAEQFYNEKLIVDVLGIGTGIGVKDFVLRGEDRVLVKGEEVEKAVGRLMGGGKEADAMRKKAKELGEMAKRAIEEGGSSYVDMDNLFEELIDRRAAISKQ